MGKVATRPHRDTEGNDVSRERLFSVCSDGSGDPLPVFLPGLAGQTPPTPGAAPWARCAPRELGLGTRQLGVSQITSVLPGMSPLVGAEDHPVVSALSPHVRRGCWGKAGEFYSSESKTHHHVPPDTSQQCGQTPASPHSPWQGAGQ